MSAPQRKRPPAFSAPILTSAPIFPSVLEKLPCSRCAPPVWHTWNRCIACGRVICVGCDMMGRCLCRVPGGPSKALYTIPP